MKKVREKEEIMKENVIKFIKNNWRWMLLFICLIGFLALAEEVFHQEIMNGDIVGYDIVSKLFKFNVSTPIAKFITNFGGAIFVISLTTILFFVIKDKKIGISIITNLGIVTILNQIINLVYSYNPYILTTLYCFIYLIIAIIVNFVYVHKLSLLFLS